MKQAVEEAKEHPVTRLFDLRDYDRLLRTFLKAGYELVDYAEARLRLGPGRDRFAVWRHDVDFCLGRALALARVEAEHGIQADYFVLLRSQMYNLLDTRELSRLKEIRRLGHRIGLYFDFALYRDAGMNSLESRIERECGVLEDWIKEPVLMVSFHRPIESLLETEISLGDRGHAYQSDFFKEMAYYSDSRGYWTHGSPVEVAAFAEGRPMQILTHPIWWCGPARQTQTERLEDFARERLDALRVGIAGSCETYHYEEKERNLERREDGGSDERPVRPREHETENPRQKDCRRGWKPRCRGGLQSGVEGAKRPGRARRIR